MMNKYKYVENRVIYSPAEV